MLPNTDDSPSKDLWMRDGWPENLYATEQLYDLELDPERGLRTGSTTRACTRRRTSCASASSAGWPAPDDPLLDGPIAPPPGALVNDADGVSALEPPQVIA